MVNKFKNEELIGKSLIDFLWFNIPNFKELFHSLPYDKKYEINYRLGSLSKKLVNSNDDEIEKIIMINIIKNLGEIKNI